MFTKKLGIVRPQHPYTQKLLQVLPRLARGPTTSTKDQAPNTPPVEPSDNPPIIQASGVGLTFGGEGGRGILAGLLGRKRDGVRALDDVSVILRRGEIVGLVGESGSGKSTLGRCLIGIYQPQTGRITVDGREAEGLRTTGDRRIQMVFQNPDSSLNPRHRIGLIVGRPMRLAGRTQREAEARVRQLLELVRLPATYADRYPHQLSGGEKQRIGIARALALEPEVLVCDEITSALDVSVQATILDLVRDLRDRLRVSILFITHDLAVVSQISDRIIVMRGGRIVEEGDAAQVISHPCEDYTRELLASVPPFVSGRRRRLVTS